MLCREFFLLQNLVTVLQTCVLNMLKCTKTHFRTEPILEKLCLNTQFGYPNFAFNLNT